MDCLFITCKHWHFNIYNIKTSTNKIKQNRLHNRPAAEYDQITI